MQGDEHSVSGEVVDRAGSPPAAALPRARGGIFSLLLLTALAFLPGFFGMPPLNREGRFAQASRQVFESVSLPEAQRDPSRHTAILPRFQDRPSVAHGPLGHWMQAASAAAFSGNNPYRDAIWMYRIPSLIAAFIVVLLTRRLAESMFDSGAARLAVVIFAVCPLAAWTGRQANADMMAAAWTLLGISGLWSVMTSASPPLRAAVAFWAALAGGTLTAGLIVPLVLISTALTAGAMSRSVRPILSLRPLLGLPLAAAAIGGWFLAVASDAPPGEIVRQMWHAIAWNGSWMPPGVHTVLSPALLWPGSLLLIPGAITAWKLRDKSPAYLFLIAWILPSWLLLEAMPGKSVTAVLPLYPALAILGARATLAADADALPGASSSPTRPGNLLWLGIGAALAVGGLGLFAGRLILWSESMLRSALLIAFGAVTALIFLRALHASWTSIQRGRFARAAIAGAGVMLLLNLTLPTFTLPRWLGLPREINTHLDRIDPSGARPVASDGFTSDGLIFLSRNRLSLLPPDQASLWLFKNPTGILIREAGAIVIGARRELATAAGFDIHRWTAVRLVIEDTAP